MPFDDTDEQERSQAMWAEFLAQLPPEFGGDPEKFLAAYHAVLVKEKSLQVYRDFYHQKYLPWQRTFDQASYQECLASLEPAQPIAPEPELVPAEPPTLPSLPRPETTAALAVPEDPAAPEETWLWADLEAEDAPDEAEEVLAPPDPEEPDTAGPEVALPLEEPPPLAAHEEHRVEPNKGTQSFT
jgi:hypothetical protein